MKDNQKIRITLISESDESLRELYHQIRGLDVSSTELTSDTSFSPGVKSRGDPITLETIVVTLATAGVFTALVETLKAWALRKESRSIKIKVQIAERTIEYEYSPAAVSKEELISFTRAVIGEIDGNKSSKSSNPKKR